MSQHPDMIKEYNEKMGGIYFNDKLIYLNQVAIQSKNGRSLKKFLY